MKMKVYRIPNDWGAGRTYEYEAPANASPQQLLDDIINRFGGGQDTLVLYDGNGAKVAGATWPMGYRTYQRHYSGWELYSLPGSEVLD